VNLPGLQSPENYGYEEFSRCITIGNIEKIQLMIAYQSVDINATDDSGYTLLMKAVRFGRLAIVKILLQHGANINCVNQAGLTALEYAIQSNRPDIEEVLHHAGAR
jgi:ankyrin repeat and MYND domain-containing protein 2